MSTPYRGRFAPSPTGPLHFGSLVSALASYLDAKQKNGRWIIRIEDVDGARCTPFFAQQIITTLNSYQLYSDEPILYQSNFSAAYEAKLYELKKQLKVFPCNCTRQSLTKHNGHHPFICQSDTSRPHSWRLKSCQQSYEYQDPIQGRLLFSNDLEITSPVLKRKDGYFSYQLAVVVDDHQQNITHLVRGADLIETTAQQLYLYELFGWVTPSICHIPLIVNLSGDKVSKQNHAQAIKNGNLHTLIRALHYLKINVTNATSINEALILATQQWNPSKLISIDKIKLEEQDQDLI
ncbi:tRNA glutamyl-Q(34) synthetase GluQRS [Marinomonas transparens]|uniref:tRNA glutamyl-Q(34) synthetase GluQRS n=1 Tax=Marinomonas transparens TaxID=2795388 RepID=A0A934JLF7_9GAMM|nr:tRNA glutamyl-Q(34) synthetase GluQRS [Marinomonas transparens]MBJ7537976.1 tRNA glutamyl-Q(34) synthetase GluQRS [Marinomonas transparens]